MKLVQSILTKNPCYTAGRKITVKGLMLHSVGCPQPKASVFINSWNSPSYDNACVHGFIDGNDGTVYQTLPWNHRGWHCGSGSKGSGNNTHIGVEMCEPACIRYTSGSNFTCSDLSTAKAVAKRTYDAAVELFAMLCKQYNLNPTADGVIVSHREGYSRGIASNHGDPEHLWNGLGMGYTMDGFRKAVKAAMGGSAAGGGSSSGSGSSGTSGFPAVPFTVKVLISDLNYRSAPSMSGSVKGQTGKGIFTIVEVKNGWGSFKKWSRMDLSGESILLYGAVLRFRRQFFQWLFSGTGIRHRPEHPERSGDQLRNYWKVHGKRDLHDCGDPIRTGFQCGLGQTEIRSRMDQSGLC